MPNLTSVGLTAGAATSGTGTVSTIDNLIGTAGTPSAQVLTMQGTASGTALNVAAHNVTNAGTFATQSASTQSGTWTVQPGNTANTTPWLTSINAGSNTATVKAASVAPSATDPALVVAMSPNGLNANGRAAPSGSAPVVLAKQGYQAVAASTTATLQVSAGATGDYFDGVLIVPSSLSPGAVSIKDGAGSAIPIFAGGASSLTTLHSFYVPITAVSAAGAWSITTGSSLTAFATGNFS